MGYQESMIDVDSLAEAAGILRAVKEAEPREWLHAFGTERSLRDLHYGDPFGFNEGRPLEKCALIPAGLLVVTVFGDRKPYQFCRDMRFLDGIVELDEMAYWRCFEGIPQEQLDQAAKNDPVEEGKAHDQMKFYLDHVWDEDRTEDMWHCRVSSVERAREKRREFDRMLSSSS